MAGILGFSESRQRCQTLTKGTKRTLKYAKSIHLVARGINKVPNGMYLVARGINKVPNSILIVPLEFGRTSNSLPSLPIGGQ